MNIKFLSLKMKKNLKFNYTQKNKNHFINQITNLNQVLYIQLFNELTMKIIS